MRFGVHLPNNFGFDNVGDLLALASHVETHGFDSVWVSEHIFNAGYVGDRLGIRPYYAPLPVLSAVAAITDRVRIGTSVLVLPYHNPIVVAKDLATMDALSQGRLIVGVGVGVVEAEFQALGCAFESRGAYTDEAIAILKTLWTEHSPVHEGRFFRFSGMPFTPRPVQVPHPPLWIGGSSRAAMRRVAMAGNGWHLFRIPAAGLHSAIAEVRARADKAGRDGRSLVMSARCDLEFGEPDDTGIAADYNADLGRRFRLKGTVPQIVDGVAELHQQGLDYLVLAANTADREKNFDTVQRFATEVAPLFAQTAASSA